MYIIETIGEVFPLLLKWISIVAVSILAPSVSIWAIIKLAKHILNKIVHR